MPLLQSYQDLECLASQSRQLAIVIATAEYVGGGVGHVPRLFVCGCQT